MVALGQANMAVDKNSDPANEALLDKNTDPSKNSETSYLDFKCTPQAQTRSNRVGAWVP